MPRVTKPSWNVWNDCLWIYSDEPQSEIRSPSHCSAIAQGEEAFMREQRTSPVGSNPELTYYRSLLATMANQMIPRSLKAGLWDRAQQARAVVINSILQSPGFFLGGGV